MKFLLLAFIISCSSATKYQKKKKGEGYTDGKKGDISYTEFYANSHTKSENALLMAQYRATEVCKPQSSYFLTTEDNSKVRNITRTSGSYPFYNTAYYPYRRGWSLGVGFGSYSSESWQDKQVYPRIRVYYLCDQKFYAPKGEFKEVSAKDLSYIYKDILGAIIVEDTASDQTELERGDIILKMDGRRVDKLAEFYYRFQKQPEQQLELLRDGRRVKIKVNAKDVTSEVIKFNEDVAKKMCELEEEFLTASPKC